MSSAFLHGMMQLGERTIICDKSGCNAVSFCASPYLARFTQRVQRVRLQAIDTHISMSCEQAEKVAWQQLEEEFCSI